MERKLHIEVDAPVRPASDWGPPITKRPDGLMW